MPTEPIHTDNELFAHIAEGNHNAYTMFLERHEDNIFSHAMAYLKDSFKAKDITQDVFLSIWNSRQSLTKVVSPENYLFILTRNKIVAEFRKKIKLSMLDDLEQVNQDTVLLPDQRLENKEMAALIQSAMDQMPPQRRTVFKLGKLEGLKYEEIAKQLNISTGTVRVHMIQALSFVRTIIRDSGTIFLIFSFFSKFF